jgi:hypothetical protein
MLTNYWDIAALFGIFMCARMGYEVGSKLYLSINHWRTWVLLILASSLCTAFSLAYIKGSEIFGDEYIFYSKLMFWFGIVFMVTYLLFLVIGYMRTKLKKTIA